MKNEVILIMAAVLCGLSFCTAPAQAKYGGGTGGPNDPYLIFDANQMNAIGADSNDWDKHFKLMADIDLSGFTETSFNIIGTFTGTFDGNGHTISNFIYTSTGTSYLGLFGYVNRETAEIKDLGLIDPDVDAGTGRYVGSLVGRLSKGKISGCYVEGGSVAGTGSVGGLVGTNGWCDLWSCWSGEISNCYSTASVSGDERVGGLVGCNEDYGTITNCYSTGSASGDEYVGGLVGQNKGTITNSYATVSATGETRVGGLVGQNGYRYCSIVCSYRYGTITNCYSSGSVTGENYVGGLVGVVKGTIDNSFWDIENSGQANSAGGIGKTTVEMQEPNTFMDAGWDFVGQPDGPHDIWAEPTGGGYPILWWQLSPLPGLPSFSGGTGQPNNPYLLSTASDLNRIGHNPRLMEEHFKLTNDIDLTGVDFFIIGSELFPFTGVFDGSGFEILNFDSTGAVFGVVNGANAKVKDLGLIDFDIDMATRNYVGALVGYLKDGTITACYAEGGSVSGNNEVGGLVGSNSKGTITNCYSAGSVSGTGAVGGLVGYNYRGTITNCYSEASVSGTGWYVGGLVGLNVDRTIANCYSTGSVSGTGRYVGGLVGKNYHGTISACYSTGFVECYELAGGLVGLNHYGRVTASFWDIETSGQTSSAGGTGKTTAEMQTTATFFVWACSGGYVWTIDEGSDYPRLWWENAPGEPITTSSYGGGSGGPNDPYLIYTAEQLNTIGLTPCDLDKNFKLMADIDLSAYTGTSFNIIGTSWGNPFTGVFDGSGQTISNFSYASTGTSFIGIFGYVGFRAEIKDLKLINPNVAAGTGEFVGSLVGGLYTGTITDCYVEGGSVTGLSSVGGLVGSNSKGTITNCYSSGSVSGNGTVGGLVGDNYVGAVTNCYSTASVSGNYHVGGLVGSNRQGTISNCYSAGSVVGEGYVGSLTGSNGYSGTITNCYANGSVSGEYYVSGLVGLNLDGTIAHCYSTGIVVGNRDVGGLVGRNRYGEVMDSFWDIETSGQSNSAGGTGKTTAEMQMASTFTDAGWDFVGETANGTDDIWYIREGVDYPRLWWENHIPVADAGADRTVEAEGAFGARITLDGSCSSDADSTPGTNDDIVCFDWYKVDACDPNFEDFLASGEIIDCNLPLGEHIIVLEVIDKAGAFDTNEVTIIVQDTTPPDFTLSVSPRILWPPNHKMVQIMPFWTVSDICDDSPEVSLVSITMNEDDETTGDGHTTDDIQVDDNGLIYLRAERSGAGSGRIYTITYQAVDDSGNAAVASATVAVPHDQR